MASKVKRSKHPGAVDSWLDGLGFYRKNVAYDETCLFRAVCEQLYDCQVYHERVRRECVEFARENYHLFTHMVNSLDEWFDHLRRLEKHMVICGNIEIEIISRKYNKDMLVFDSVKMQLYNVTDRNLPECLMLCLMGEDHYDVVYKREHIVTAGFCQSMVYQILYENVYRIPNVLDIVNNMLYEKSYTFTPHHVLNQVNVDSKEESNESGSPGMKTNTFLQQPTCLAPFPFKVAKALDPTIYRNIEYDSWTEVRRELRLGEWYYGDNKLILGTRCIYRDPNNNNSHECYIQQILKDENKCVVYITKLAERRTVDYDDLSPEDNAKPWPLPYRFTKNLVLSVPPQNGEKTKSPKKKKDKRRTQSCSEAAIQSNNVTNVTNVEALSEEDIKAFLGFPLQMQNSQDNKKACQESEILTNNAQQHDVTMTSPGNNRYPWPNQWSPYVPTTTDSFIWPTTPASPHSMFHFNMKPLVASAPVTPDVIPYHDFNYPYYCNYPVDPYNGYSSWVPTCEYQPLQSSPSQKLVEDPNITQESCQNVPRTTYIQTVESYETNPVERPTVCTTMTPATPQVEVYSPVIAIPPGTPLMYTPQHPPPEITDMVVTPAPIPMFTPPVESVYISSSPFIYPPTPPTAWFPPGVNAQGFIFPPPIPPQNVSN